MPLRKNICDRVRKRPGALRQSDFDGDQQPIVRDMVRHGELARDRFGFLSMSRKAVDPQGSEPTSVIIRQYLERYDALLQDSKTRAAFAVCVAMLLAFLFSYCWLCLLEGRADIWHDHGTVEHDQRVRSHDVGA